MNKKTRWYTKTRVLIFLVLSLLCWSGIDDASSYNATKSEDKIMYALFKDRFTEPMEVMYFLMDDMGLYKITSNDENKIRIGMQELKKKFKQGGYDISNIIVVIHNHMKHAYFSPGDVIVYRIFKGEGFEGKYYIYVYRTKGIYELAERLR